VCWLVGKAGIELGEAGCLGEWPEGVSTVTAHSHTSTPHLMRHHGSDCFASFLSAFIVIGCICHSGAYHLKPCLHLRTPSPMYCSALLPLSRIHLSSVNHFISIVQECASSFSKSKSLICLSTIQPHLHLYSRSKAPRDWLPTPGAPMTISLHEAAQPCALKSDGASAEDIGHLPLAYAPMALVRLLGEAHDMQERSISATPSTILVTSARSVPCF
jgi:hypothetical protein